MKKNKITLQELSKLLNISSNTLRIHLSCLEKYKVPRTHPTTFFYNYFFLLDLQKLYKEKSESIGKGYEKYEKVVAKLDKIIQLWIKVNRANLC